MSRWSPALRAVPFRASLRPVLVAALASALGLAQPAFASPTDDIAAVETAASTMDSEVAALSARGIPTEPPIVQRDAIARYQDYVYLHLIGQDREAAEGFYGLVISEALDDEALSRDAEWQLAESLFAIGNVVTAEERFTAIMGHAGHPFRQDAVRNLLELYGKRNDHASFKRVYDAEIVSGKVATTPEITYTLAQSFYWQGDMAKAQEHFQAVPADSSWYSRAQYFLGVIAIRQERVDDSAPFFQAAAGAAVTSSSTRDAHDLSLLALARLAYERGDFRVAADNYAQIGGDSAYLADILYETVWSFIKQDRYDEALKAIDLFLLAFPEHRYNGELRVKQGTLYMGCAQTPAKCPRPPLYEGGDAYDQALATYEQIVADYEPIRARFEAFAASTDDPRTYFRDVLTMDASTADGRSDAERSAIPSFAIAMMQSDPQLGKALEVYRALEIQRQDLEASERMIGEIDQVLSQEGGIGAVGRLRLDAIGLQGGAVEQEIALLAAEADLLKGLGVRGGSAAVTDVAALSAARESGRARRESASRVDARIAEITARKQAQMKVAEAAEETLSEIVLQFQPDQTQEEREASERRMADANRALDAERQKLRSIQVELTSAQVPGPEMVAAGLPDAATELRTRLQGMRPKSQAQFGARIDAAHQKLDRVLSGSAEVLSRIDAFSQTEFGRIQERFQAEVVKVAAQRQDLDRVTAASDAVSVDLTREGFVRMEAFFADSVLDADKGVIDVYWARKLELADERNRVQDERNLLVAELERRFRLIRQKMEQ